MPLFTAAVLENIRETLVIRSLEVPQHLGVGQVLIQVKYSGVCGAQLNEQDGIKGADRFLPHCLKEKEVS